VEELLAGLLWIVADFLLELFAELIAAAVFDFASRAFLGLFTGLTGAVRPNRVVTSLIYALLGGLAGVFSLLVLPHPLIHRADPGRFHGISLLVSPVVVGLVLSSVGNAIRRWNKKVVPVETFGYGFVFALGMALIRFFFAK
jgi:hypothetical protein